MSDSVRPHGWQLTGSPIPGILQARTLEWVAISYSKCMKLKSESEVVQSCQTLSDPMDFSPPGSSIHGLFQARVPKWGAIARLDETQAGIKIAGRNTNNLRYADDTTLKAESKKELKSLLMKSKRRVKKLA